MHRIQAYRNRSTAEGPPKDWRYGGPTSLRRRLSHCTWALRCRKTTEGPPKKTALRRRHLSPPEAVALYLGATRPQNNRRSAEKAAPQRPHLPPPRGKSVSSANRERGTSGPSLKKSALKNLRQRETTRIQCDSLAAREVGEFGEPGERCLRPVTEEIRTGAFPGPSSGRNRDGGEGIRPEFRMPDLRSANLWVGMRCN
jgi:hypothetical protein